MAAIAALSLISTFGKSTFKFLAETAWPFLKKNWKLVLQVALLLWVIVCSLTHCAGIKTPWSNTESGDTTVTIKVDTAWVYPDTNAIFVLYGFDTLPNYVEHLQQRTRFRTPTAVFHPFSSCRDSVVVLRSLNQMQSLVIAECDSAYADAVAVRSYGDTLTNDSIEVTLNFRVQGHLRGTPVINYRYLAPYPVVTIEKTVEVKTVDGPYSKIYLEGGVGALMTWENQLGAVTGSVGLGYTDKRNWSYGARGSFNQVGYTVEGTFRKSFDIGKK